MSERNNDLRDRPTAYDCRDQLPQLAWMDDDSLKQLRIWRGPRFERGQMYFDLDNPDRGPFVANGDEAVPTDWTYVSQAEVPMEVWTQLTTWRQPVSEMQGDSIQQEADAFGSTTADVPTGSEARR